MTLQRETSRPYRCWLHLFPLSVEVISGSSGRLDALSRKVSQDMNVWGVGRPDIDGDVESLRVHVLLDGPFDRVRLQRGLRRCVEWQGGPLELHRDGAVDICRKAGEFGFHFMELAGPWDSHRVRLHFACVAFLHLERHLQIRFQWDNRHRPLARHRHIVVGVGGSDVDKRPSARGKDCSRFRDLRRVACCWLGRRSVDTGKHRIWVAQKSQIGGTDKFGTKGVGGTEIRQLANGFPDPRNRSRHAGVRHRHIGRAGAFCEERVLW